MLYEILMVILVVYAISSPLWVMKSIKFGVKFALDAEKTSREPVINIPKPKRKQPEVKLSKEEQKIIDTLENINAFDGTETGQKEIKE